MKDLRDKVAVVTGGGSGIGSALCHALADAGMRLMIADIDEDRARSTREEIAASGAPAARAARTDVSDRRSVEALAEQTLQELGAVHLVCNNAGVCSGGDLLLNTETEWRWLLDVNLMGVVHGCLVFAPLLIEQGEGHILNTASLGALLPFPELGVYTATKAAVANFSESLRAYLDPHGIGVSILCPGPVRTGLPEADRLRPQGPGAYGGTARVLTPMIEDGMDPLEVGPIAVEGIRRNAEYIFTHTDLAEVIQARFQRILEPLR